MSAHDALAPRQQARYRCVRGHQADWDEMQAELAELERGVRPAPPAGEPKPVRDPASTTTASLLEVL